MSVTKHSWIDELKPNGNGEKRRKEKCNTKKTF